MRSSQRPTRMSHRARVLISGASLSVWLIGFPHASRASESVAQRVRQVGRTLNLKQLKSVPGAARVERLVKMAQQLREIAACETTLSVNGRTRPKQTSSHKVPSEPAPLRATTSGPVAALAQLVDDTAEVHKRVVDFADPLAERQRCLRFSDHRGAIGAYRDSAGSLDSSWETLRLLVTTQSKSIRLAIAAEGRWGTHGRAIAEKLPKLLASLLDGQLQARPSRHPAVAVENPEVTIEAVVGMRKARELERALPETRFDNLPFILSAYHEIVKDTGHVPRSSEDVRLEIWDKFGVKMPEHKIVATIEGLRRINGLEQILPIVDSWQNSSIEAILARHEPAIIVEDWGYLCDVRRDSTRGAGTPGQDFEPFSLRSWAGVLETDLPTARKRFHSINATLALHGLPQIPILPEQRQPKMVELPRDSVATRGVLAAMRKHGVVSAERAAIIATAIAEVPFAKLGDRENVIAALLGPRWRSTMYRDRVDPLGDIHDLFDRQQMEGVIYRGNSFVQRAPQTLAMLHTLYTGAHSFDRAQKGDQPLGGLAREHWRLFDAVIVDALERGVIDADEADVLTTFARPPATMKAKDLADDVGFVVRGAGKLWAAYPSVTGATRRVYLKLQEAAGRDKPVVSDRIIRKVEKDKHLKGLARLLSFEPRELAEFASLLGVEL